MEKFIMILDKFVEYLISLADRPFITFTLIDLLLVIGMGAGIVYFVKYLVKAFMQYGFSGLKIVYRPFTVVYVKNKNRRKKKRICHVCKNPLHKCTCPNNRGVPYRQRLAKWKAVEKANKLARKQEEYRKKELNKPVELKKKKRRRGGN